MLQLFFGDQLFIPQPLRAHIVRFENFRFCCQFFKSAAMQRVLARAASRFAISWRLSSRAEFCRRLPCTGIRGYIGDNAIALRGHIYLVFDDQGCM